MAELVTHGFAAKKGVEYTNFTGAGNALRFTEDTRISINRSPFGTLQKNYHLFVTPHYTYSFEKDTMLWVTNEIQPDFYVVHEEYSALDVALTTNTESAAIVTVSDSKAITTGEIASNCFIENAGNQNGNAIITFYNAGTLIYTSPAVPVNKDLTTQVVASFDTSGLTIAAGAVVDFRVETTVDTTIKGSQDPSHIRLTRKNL